MIVSRRFLVRVLGSYQVVRLCADGKMKEEGRALCQYG